MEDSKFEARDKFELEILQKEAIDYERNDWTRLRWRTNYGNMKDM